MIKKFLLIAAAAVGGIYLTSEEGKEARLALLRKKATFEPIIKDLIQQINDMLSGAEKINSDQVRANVDLLLKEAKGILIDLDVDKAATKIREAISVSSRKIREANEEFSKEMITNKNKALSGSKSKTKPKSVNK